MSVLELETTFRKLMIDEKEICLLHTLFGDRAAKETVEYLTEGLDVDTENVNYMLMLSSLGLRDGWDFFPPRIVPRVKGLHKFYQVRTASKIPWLLKQLEKLQNAGIDFMLLKGVAMYAYYAPDKPRLMGDFDLYTDESCREKVLQVMQTGDTDMTYHSRKECTFVPKDSGGKKLFLDINFYPFRKFRSDALCTKIFSEAIGIDFHGCRTKVPSPRDMFIHTMYNRFDNLIRSESPLRRMKWLYDCACVAELAERSGKRLKASDIVKRAEEIGIRYTVRLMLTLFMQVFPGMVDDDRPEALQCDSKKYEKWLETELDLYHRFTDVNKRYGNSEEAYSLKKYMSVLRLYHRQYQCDRMDGKSGNSFSAYLLSKAGSNSYRQLFARFVGKLVK